MFGISKTLGSIVLVVVFLALAGLATFFYNLDKTGQADVASNSLAQKGKSVVDVVLNVSGDMADSNLESNTGFGNKMVTTARNFITNTDWKGLMSGTKTVATPIINPNSEAPGFFSRLITGIKNEWNKIREEASYSGSGTEKIFDVKSGVEENVTSAANQ